MKIAKVNHVKTAVSTEGQNQEGILYKNPSEGQKSTDIERHIESLFKNAERFDNFRFHIDEKASQEEKEKIKRKKEKYKKDVKKSIENQNMLVQPMESELGEMVIALSMVKDEQDQKADSENVLSRKGREKTAFRRFLSDYADLDVNKRNEMLRKIRRIVIAYFYGPELLDDTIQSDFDVWDDHKKRQEDQSRFIEHGFPNISPDKKDENKAIIEENYKTLKENIRKRNIDSYRMVNSYVSSLSSVQKEKLFFADQDINDFWIHHIENEVERIYGKEKRLNKNNTYKLCKGYISEKVWKGIINYICVKYIAIGKVVYNMAMEDLTEDGDENLGIISPMYKDGISSFDYEMIKAEERLQRETAVYVSSAINYFFSATVDRGEDVEKYDIADEIEKIKKLPNIKRNILQFFGGNSRWNKLDLTQYSSDAPEEYMWLQIQKILYSMRNESFHFKTKNIKTDWDKKLISDMFEFDSSSCSRAEADKFYSNNIPMFYSSSDIEKLMHKLYDKYVFRASQVPAFNTVFVRKTFPTFISEKLGIKQVYSDKELVQFQSALYYLLKEVYYNAFLSDGNAKELFLAAVKSMDENDEKHKFAVKDFKRRIREITTSGNYSLSEICQIIMTEQNQQNDKWMKKRTLKGKVKVPDGYQHYKILLFEGLMNAFVSYLKKNPDMFGFINSPSIREMPAIESFLPDYKTDKSDNAELQKWYIMGRLLYPKQINQLAGCIRNYIQYKWDIERRAADTGNELKVSNDLCDRLEKALQVVEICNKLSGIISHDVKDYFDDEDDYAGYLSNFLDYEAEMKDFDISPAGKLKNFCFNLPKDEDDPTAIGIYYDEKNPIPNRNIVLSKIFGAGEIIADALKDNKVSLSEIREYYSSKDELTEYRKTGEFKNIEEIKKIKKYQELKNHVELRDIVEYAEVINELQGQLINWTYLRERDLLYFQLGFHYNCLLNDSYKPNDYKKIVAEDKTINNAILHQIASLYINGIYLYTSDNGVYTAQKDSSTGGNIRVFFDYCKNVFTEYKDILTVYSAGLELFETIKEHEEIINLRNYIDHSKYFSMNPKNNLGHSMIDIYSEIFDRFFTYDLKYHKNVPNVLYNIFMTHFVDLSISFSTGTKMVQKGNKKHPAEYKDRATLKINKVKSEPFTYNLPNEKVKCPAKSETFMRNMIKILYYREENEPEVIYQKSIIKGVTTNKPGEKNINVRKNNQDDRNNKQKKDKNQNSNKLSENSFGYFDFSGFGLK